MQALQLGQAGRHPFFTDQHDGTLAGVVEVGKNVGHRLVQQVLHVIDDQRAAAA
ncbi:hypothetical protein FQZ97_1105140 [compost metagenome]